MANLPFHLATNVRFLLFLQGNRFMSHRERTGGDHSACALCEFCRVFSSTTAPWLHKISKSWRMTTTANIPDFIVHCSATETPACPLTLLQLVGRTLFVPAAPSAFARSSHALHTVGNTDIVAKAQFVDNRGSTITSGLIGPPG